MSAKKIAHYGFFKNSLMLFLCTVFSNFTSAQIIHIHNIHCKLDKEDTQTFNRIARYEAELYNAIFETSKNDSLEINIYLYGRQKDFKLTPDGINTLQASADGYTLAHTNDIYVMKNDHVNSVLLHEISHAFLHYNMPNPPKWFDEGMATYCGSLVVQDKKIYYTPVAGRIARINELQANKQLNLAKFLQNKDNNWGSDREQVSDHYTIAYSIIYFLVNINLNFVKYLSEQLKEGRPAVAILSDLFAGDFKFFEERYKNFYEKQN